MKCVRTAGIIAAAGWMIMLFSCNRNERLLAPQADGSAAGIFSRVESMTQIEDSGQGLRWSFAYNKYGDPESIIPNEISTGRPGHSFLYDIKKRLVQHLQFYDYPGGFERFTEYIYDPAKPNRVLRDTTYNFGDLVNGRPQIYMTKTYTRYWYDSLDRIVQERRYLLEPQMGDSLTFTYAYDQHGNLIRNGVTYDDKVNIHRASRVFMFLDRDYSVNNPFQSSEYTRQGMPKHIVEGWQLPNLGYFLDMHLYDARVSYPSDTPPLP